MDKDSLENRAYRLLFANLKDTAQAKIKHQSSMIVTTDTLYQFIEDLRVIHREMEEVLIILNNGKSNS